MRKVIVKQLDIVCFRCRGAKVLCFPDGSSVMCPKCLGRGTLPTYGKEEVDDGEDDKEEGKEETYKFSWNS